MPTILDFGLQQLAEAGGQTFDPVASSIRILGI
jgi:hypothetical protein